MGTRRHQRLIENSPGNEGVPPSTRAGRPRSQRFHVLLAHSARRELALQGRHPVNRAERARRQGCGSATESRVYRVYSR